MSTETLAQMHDRFHKERELEYKQVKEKITFQLRGDNKYYYAFQCALFEKNIIKYGYDSYANKSSAAKEGLIFSDYKITFICTISFKLQSLIKSASVY